MQTKEGCGGFGGFEKGCRVYALVGANGHT